MPFKVTFIFRAYNGGWSETWYQATGDPRVAQGRAGALMSFRADLMGAGVVLQAYKLIDLATPRMSSIVEVNIDPVLARGQVKPNRDSSYQAILCSVYADATNRRSFLLRGFPDDLVKISPTTGTWTEYLPVIERTTAFKTELTNLGNGWCLRGLQRTGPANASVPVLAISVPVGGGVPTLTLAPSALRPGQFVRLSGGVGEGLKPFRGVWELRATAQPLQFTIDLVVPPASLVRYQGGMIASPRNVGLSQITGFDVRRPARRSTGRAFFVEAGRHLKRR